MPLNSVTKKTNVTFEVISCLIVVCMITIIVFNYKNADYQAYERMYNNIKSGMVDFGFIVLMKLGRRLNLSFAQFRAFYLATAVCFMYYGISFFCEDVRFKPIALLCYSAYPFLLDAVQMRHMMAFAIVFVGLTFLHSDCFSKPTRILLFLITIILSASQHLSNAIYILLILSIMDERKLRFTEVCLFLLIITIAFFLSRYSTTILDYVENNDIALPGMLIKLKKYFVVEEAYQWRELRFHDHIFLSTLIVVILQCLPPPISNRGQAVRKILLISICLTPFIIVDQNCYRLYRSLLVFAYVGLSCDLSDKKIQGVILSLLLVSVLFFKQMSKICQTHYDEMVWIPMFKNNYLFEKIASLIRFK